VTLTNTTTSAIQLPGFSIPASGSAVLADSRYLSDEALRDEVNDLVAVGTLTVTNPPAGFPVATGEDTGDVTVFGAPFAVRGASGLVLRVDANGNVHIKTGKTVVADLP
jgi:hypothetical protein